MFRKDLAEFLENSPMTVREIARLLQVKAADVVDDLCHVERSLKHTDKRLCVHPARCRKCGFTFREETWSKPGKCPECKGTWITEPRLEVVSR